MSRNYPSINLPTFHLDVEDHNLISWCLDLLHSLEWCKSPLMPFVFAIMARRRGEDQGIFPAEPYDYPFLYEIFQDYSWEVMPQDLKEYAVSKGAAWFALCHNFTGFKEIAQAFNAKREEAFRICQEANN